VRVPSPTHAALFYFVFAAFALDGLSVEQKPLTRTFTNGATERYQVSVTIRAETHGVSTEKVGEKTYVKPFAHEAEGHVSWRAVRQVAAVKEDGRAAVEENLEQFGSTCDQPVKSAAAEVRLQKSVEELCSRWQNLLKMSYEEEKYGLIHGLPEAASQLAGSDSPFLSLWLRRAFRPSVILPKESIRFGIPVEHKIGGAVVSSGKPSGTETIEWAAGGSEPPAVILHVTQSLSWFGRPAAKQENDSVQIPTEKATFYADSLNTISLLDGSVLSASRSATCETREVLDAVPGLPEAPEFGSKLTVTVTMRRLP
jgi:hypothetical protein